VLDQYYITTIDKKTFDNIVFHIKINIYSEINIEIED